MEGAIICRDNDNLYIIAMGYYENLVEQLDMCQRLVGDREVLLLDTSGLNMEEISMDQTLVNQTFAQEFGLE